MFTIHVVAGCANYSKVAFGMVFLFYIDKFLSEHGFNFLSFLNKFSFYTKFGYNGCNLVLMMNDN